MSYSSLHKGNTSNEWSTLSAPPSNLSLRMLTSREQDVGIVWVAKCRLLELTGGFHTEGALATKGHCSQVRHSVTIPDSPRFRQKPLAEWVVLCLTPQLPFANLEIKSADKEATPQG